MKSRNIIFTSPSVAELVEEETRAPSGSEVTVRLVRSTISSGTERANLLGDLNVNIFVKTDKPVFPRRSGYSASGVVVETGPGVTSLQKGDRVALFWSTHSQYCVIDEKRAVKLPDSVSFAEGALMHISAFPMAAIRKCRLEIGESALVMGQGVLGKIAVAFLRAAGAVPVIAVDPVPEKRLEALAEGADYAFDPFEKDFASKVKSVTDGGVNVAIEVTGNGKALDQCLDCMKKFGRVALLGCTRSSDFTIDYYRKVHGPGITMIGAHTAARPEVESSQGMWTTRDDMKAEATLCSYGRLRLENLIKEVHSPVDAPAVYKRLAEEKAFPLVQFDWSKLYEEN